MGEQARVLQKGKITIPADIRQKLGINEGDYVKLEIVGNRLMCSPRTPSPTRRNSFQDWPKESKSQNQ